MPDVAAFVAGLIAAIVVVAILSDILLRLWNITMPGVFGLKLDGEPAAVGKPGE